MNEYIYKISIESFEHMIKPIGHSLIKQNHNFAKHSVYSYSTIILPEYENFLDIEWSLVHYFFKPDFQGLIHTDLHDEVECMWGLNWIVNYSSTVEYWPFSSVENDTTVDNSSYQQDYKKRSVFKTSVEPEKTYALNSGVYLVNASIPHRFTGHGPRHSFILRPKKKYLISWNDTVKRFQKYINTV